MPTLTPALGRHKPTPGAVLPRLARPGVGAEPGSSRTELWEHVGSLGARWLVVARHN